MRGLYAIVDVTTLEREGLEPVRFAEALLEAGPAALQLRDKRGHSRATLDLLTALAPLAARAAVPLFANDRPDLAVLGGCAGAHLGRTDVPAPRARELFRSMGKAHMLVGLSAHDGAQLEQCLEEQPDYLAFGPVLATRSKVDPEPVIGLDGLAALVAQARHYRPELPCVAIGGITADTAPLVARICPCAAVIAALVPPATLGAERYAEVTRRARALGQMLRLES